MTPRAIRRYRVPMTIGLVPALAGAALMLAGSPLAGAASGTHVGLNLKGGYANHQKVACGDLHHYTYYHKRSRIKFDGRVRPAPSGSWDVKLKLKKCIHGTFKTVHQAHFKGRHRGRFDGSFHRKHTGFYFARIYYYGVSPAAESDKAHFRIKH
jgi:hypothetical protein